MSFKAPTPDPDSQRRLFQKLPEHIAIIMDGNGRWAEKKAYHRIRGHWEGARRVDEITTECAKLGVKYLTLYAFSTENWNRPTSEVNMLMRILVHYLKSMESKLVRNRIALVAQGMLYRLPEKVRHWLDRVRTSTSHYEPRMILNLSLSYGGRAEIVESARQLARKVEQGKIKISDITEETLQQHLYQPDIPDPDLLIRSGGETRVSNFLLWQVAYSEIYVTETLWPNFFASELHRAIENFGDRERRFGKTSAQIEQTHTENTLDL